MPPWSGSSSIPKVWPVFNQNDPVAYEELAAEIDRLSPPPEK